MTRTTKSVKISGTKGVPTLIECLVDKGLGIHIVGVSDQSARESLLRTVTALQSCGYSLPGKKIVFNVAPADLHKSSTGYDLPIALTLIAASGQDNGLDNDGSGNLRLLLASLSSWLVIGELGLDGSVRDVPGCIQAVEAAIAEGCEGVIIPKGNSVEVIDLFTEKDIPICGVGTLKEAVACIAGPSYFPTIWDAPKDRSKKNHVPEGPVWNRLGDASQRRALEIAASGGHHVFLVGPNGSCKETAAKALRDILPPMTREEALSVARVYSVYGSGQYRAACKDDGVYRRPFRNPHYSCSLTALLGGGCGEKLTPGEVSLATEGVLCLNDFTEMPKSMKEALRGPLEDRKVVLTRLHSKVEYPARFQLVLTTAPCPCGRYGEGDDCVCSPSQRTKFLQGIWGPVYDMTDIQVFVRKFNPFHKAELPEEEQAEAVAKRVAKARDIQCARLGEGRLNADMTSKELELHCRLKPAEKELLEKLYEHLGLSMRAYTRILKIARTIADMNGHEDIGTADLAEAASYRFLDRFDTLHGVIDQAS